MIQAQAYGLGPNSGGVAITFVVATGPTSRYGTLGNLDRVFLAHGRTLAGVEVGGQGFQWTAGSGASVRFTGGDNDTKYHISLNFAALTDKIGRAVPMNDCRKIYMVFAPRFEAAEAELQDGCFLSAGVDDAATVWAVDDVTQLSGGRYFIGDSASEERVLLAQTSTGQITVLRGYEGTEARAWPAGTRMMKLSPRSGFASDVEWRAVISNIAVTGDASLKVGGGSARIEESDARCRYTGYWEDYKYGAGWPSQWWAGGHAKRTAPASGGDLRKVAFSYSQTQQHDLYLGTFLNTDCGKVSVSVDGVTTTHDLYLNEYGGTVANLKVRGSVPAGNHTVEITALFDRNAASAGYYFYFDYLWPLVPQDVPDPPQEYEDVSLAIDFDTDHGYKKPPAWHLWQLQRLGFQGHADVYMGVFWNNKRQRIGAVYPYATVVVLRRPGSGRRGVDLDWRDHGRSRHRLWGDVAVHRVPRARDGQRAVLRRVGRRQLRIEPDRPDSVQGSKLHVHRLGGKHAKLRDAYTHRPHGVGGHGGRLATARLGVARHDGGRAEVDSRSRRPVRGGGHPGVVRVLDGGLQSSRRDARQVPAIRGRRGLPRPGRLPRGAFAPDALRHARPELPAPDVQGVRRRDRGGRPAGRPPVWRDAVVVLRQPRAGRPGRDAVL